MLDQNLFTETLKEVAEIVKTSATPMSKEEILSYFADMELSEENKELVFTYLSTPQEDDPITDPTPAKEQTKEDSVISLEELAKQSPVFAMYMEEVRNLKRPTANEMNDLYEQLSAGDEPAIETILHAWLPQVLEASKSYWSGQVNLEDVIQEGNMSLFLALKEACGSHKNVMEIQLALMPALTDGMKRYISEMSGEEESEETIAAKANMVEQATKTLQDANGYEPSLAELGEYTHMEEAELEDILAIMKKAKDAARKKKSGVSGGNA